MDNHNTGRLLETVGLMKMQLTQTLYDFFSLFIFETRFLVCFVQAVTSGLGLRAARFPTLFYSL